METSNFEIINEFDNEITVRNFNFNNKDRYNSGLGPGEAEDDLLDNKRTVSKIVHVTRSPPRSEVSDTSESRSPSPQKQGNFLTNILKSDPDQNQLIKVCLYFLLIPIAK